METPTKSTNSSGLRKPTDSKTAVGLESLSQKNSAEKKQGGCGQKRSFSSDSTSDNSGPPEPTRKRLEKQSSKSSSNSPPNEAAGVMIAQEQPQEQKNDPNEVTTNSSSHDVLLTDEGSENSVDSGDFFPRVHDRLKDGGEILPMDSGDFFARIHDRLKDGREILPIESDSEELNGYPKDGGLQQGEEKKTLEEQAREMILSSAPEQAVQWSQTDRDYASKAIQASIDRVNQWFEDLPSDE